MIFNNEQIGAILAGLRLLQQKLRPTTTPDNGYYEVVGTAEEEEVNDILTDDRLLEPLSPDEIDSLCETLNDNGMVSGQPMKAEALFAVLAGLDLLIRALNGELVSNPHVRYAVQVILTNAGAAPALTLKGVSALSDGLDRGKIVLVEGGNG